MWSESTGSPRGLYKATWVSAPRGPGTALLFLSLRASSEDEKFLVRTILAINEEDQSMTFAGNLPEGSLVQLMRANFDRLIDGAHEAATLTRSDEDVAPQLALAVSCGSPHRARSAHRRGGRGRLDPLPKDAQMIGFYSYGEISPFGTGRCDLHNQTMCITTLAEAA
jgi:hypothetical protein